MYCIFILMNPGFVIIKMMYMHVPAWKLDISNTYLPYCTDYQFSINFYKRDYQYFWIVW